MRIAVNKQPVFIAYSGFFSFSLSIPLPLSLSFFLFLIESSHAELSSAVEHLPDWILRRHAQLHLMQVTQIKGCLCGSASDSYGGVSFPPAPSGATCFS